MNAFGEPNMGNPSVRFDEGRERVWSLAFAPLNPTVPAYSTYDLHLRSRRPVVRRLAARSARSQYFSCGQFTPTLRTNLPSEIDFLLGKQVADYQWVRQKLWVGLRVAEEIEHGSLKMAFRTFSRAPSSDANPVPESRI